MHGRDRWVVALMVIVPSLLVLGLVWFPAISSVLLSFTSWNGIGDISDAEFIGLKNYSDVVNIYPPFWPAVRHNLIWLGVLFVAPTVFGIFLAVLLDKELRGSRFYQTALYMPVVLSLALIGFNWRLMYSRDQGLINAVFNSEVDWYGNPDVNLWAVLLATSWRHAGYIMLLYLAGLKGVDNSLREGSGGRRRERGADLLPDPAPGHATVNLIVIVVVVIESLRAFDLVWVINKGTNGLELIAALVTADVVGEASRIGFGSAMAVIMLVISSVYTFFYLRVVMREDRP